MRRRVALVVFIAAMYPTIAAASDYPVDLATHPGGEVDVSISPGRVRPVVLHRLPGAKYNVEIVQENIPVEPLGMPSGVTIPLGAAVDPECFQLKADFDKISAPTDEVGVGKAATDIGVLLSATKCTGQVKDEVAAALAKYANALPFDEYVMNAGQRLRVKIDRLDAKGQPEKTWTLTLSTGARGEWLTTYGLTFVPLRDHLFFSKQGTEQGKYVITAQRDDAQSGLRFIPSVLFSWMPSKWANGNWAISPTAGFGTNGDAFAILGGATLTYNTNLGFSGGIAAVQQRRLLGQYTENQTVSENLTEDQLHHRVLMPAAFVSVTLRFSANPFAKPSGDEPEKPKEEPKKADDNKPKGDGK